MQRQTAVRVGGGEQEAVEAGWPADEVRGASWADDVVARFLNAQEQERASRVRNMTGQQVLPPSLLSCLFTSPFIS